MFTIRLANAGGCFGRFKSADEADDYLISRGWVFDDIGINKFRLDLRDIPDKYAEIVRIPEIQNRRSLPGLRMFK